MKQLIATLLAGKGRVSATRPLRTPLSLSAARNFQIRLRHDENLTQIEVAKNRRR